MKQNMISSWPLYFAYDTPVWRQYMLLSLLKYVKCVNFSEGVFLGINEVAKANKYTDNLSIQVKVK